MFADLLLGQKISVGPPFFNTAILPLAVPLIGAMAVGPVMPWKRARLFPALQRVWWAALGGFAALLLCLALAGGPVRAAPGVAAGGLGGGRGPGGQRAPHGRVARPSADG